MQLDRGKKLHTVIRAKETKDEKNLDYIYIEILKTNNDPFQQ